MAARARIVICLMRNDLRYHDNEVLLWAHRNADHVLPLYCFDPRHYKGTYNFSFPKTGPHRAKFLLESLQDLRNTLKQHGSGLVVRSGEPEKILPQLVQQLGKDSVSAIAYQQEVTQEELDVEKGIQSNSGVKTHAIWGSTLVNKADLPFPVSQLPDVYTQFRKRVEQGCQIRPVLGMPDKLRPLPPGIEEGDMPTLESLGVERVEPDSRSAFPFSGGETTALDRMDHYYWRTDKVAKYKETRNGMIGADYSTKFSPWLAYGCISPRFIYAEKTRYEAERTANQSTYWVIFELLWRDYFRFVGLKYGTKLFCLEGIIGKNKPWRQDKKLFQAWKEGRTGVPYVDANMREMAATGFMSNRGRQNVASFLTKDLQLDWRLGAEWFESQLVDHDVCSNYGNWQYSAGIGNDPREDRKFNMVKQGLDYDADGQYVRLWVPELEGIKGGDAHIPWTLNSAVLSHAQVQLGETYPNPIVIAPEWSRHTKKGSARGRPGGRKEMPKQKRGMDFYFKSSGSKH